MLPSDDALQRVMATSGSVPSNAALRRTAVSRAAAAIDVALLEGLTGLLGVNPDEHREPPPPLVTGPCTASLCRR